MAAGVEEKRKKKKTPRVDYKKVGILSGKWTIHMIEFNKDGCKPKYIRMTQNIWKRTYRHLAYFRNKMTLKATKEHPKLVIVWAIWNYAYSTKSYHMTYVMQDKREALNTKV